MTDLWAEAMSRALRVRACSRWGMTRRTIAGRILEHGATAYRAGCRCSVCRAGHDHGDPRAALRRAEQGAEQVAARRAESLAAARRAARGELAALVEEQAADDRSARVYSPRLADWMAAGPGVEWADPTADAALAA